MKRSKAMSIISIALCILINSLVLVMLDSAKVHAGGAEVVTYPITHKHIGRASDGSGCYNSQEEYTYQVEIPCGGTLYYWGDDYGTSECNKCGASYYGNRNGESCPHSEYRDETEYYYVLGCGHEAGETVGYVTYTRDTTDWTKAVNVSINYTNTGCTIAANPFSMNGGRSSNNTFKITENGDYNFALITGDDSTVSSHTMNIRNIDHTGPTVRSAGTSPTTWTTGSVTFTLSNVADLQPDGSGGCGLHSSAYSYNGGSSWTSSKKFTCDSNGSYRVVVRDNLGNTTDYRYTVSNIDREAPRIRSFDYDHSPNVKQQTITVACDDVLSDGRPGAGLDALPYSYDGGQTWTDSTVYTLTENATVQFRVKDKLGNVASRDEVINNIDITPPRVSHTSDPIDWTNTDVTVIFSAEDLNEDETEGVGLPADCYSYDNGETWTEDNTVSQKENGTISVLVRDSNDNITQYDTEVSNIDTEPPVIKLKCTASKDALTATLDSVVTDEGSGIDPDTLKWSTGDDTDTIKVDKNGRYSLSCSDIAGNTTTAFVQVTCIKVPEKEKPKKEPEKEPEKKPDNNDDKDKEKDKNDETNTGQDIDPSDDGDDDNGDNDDGRDDDDSRVTFPSITLPDIITNIIPDIRPIQPSEETDATDTTAINDINNSSENTETVEKVLPERASKAGPKILSDINKKAPKRSFREKVSDFWVSLSLWQKILLILLMILIIVGLFILLLLWYLSVAILNCHGKMSDDPDAEDRYVFMGYRLIHKDNGNHMVSVNEQVWEKSQTTEFRFKFNPLFAYIHKDEQVYFSFPEEIVKADRIARNVDVIVR